MNGSDRNENTEESDVEWQIEVLPQRVVTKPTSHDDDDRLDWNKSTFAMTLRGSLQSGYDLSDAIGAAATFYFTIARRDRQSDPASARAHDDLARRMSVLAVKMEEQLNVVLDVPEDGVFEVADRRQDGKATGDE